MREYGYDIANAARNGVKWVYWYGGKRELCTSSLAKRLQTQYPSVWTADYLAKAQIDIEASKTCCDCSGLVCYALDISDIGSSQIKERAKEWGGSPHPGMIAWKQGHVGIVIDNKGTIAEMRSQAYDYKENRTYKDAGMSLYVMDGVVYEDYEAVGWHRDGNGWWYRNKAGTGAGTYYTNGVYWVNGHEYYFDEEGYICSMLRVPPDATEGWIR